MNIILSDIDGGNSMVINNTVDGYLSNIEIFGNTVQNNEDLYSVESVGIPTDDGQYLLKLNLSIIMNLIKNPTVTL